VDFFQVATRETKNGLEVFPDFTVGRSKDLMVRGRAFYAIWDEERQLWSTDEYDVQRLVDQALLEYAAKQKDAGMSCSVKTLSSFGSNGWTQFRKFVGNISDNHHQLDETLTFANTTVKKGDYVSRRLPYALAPGSYKAWDELIGTLYNEEERTKIEWAIGSVISGDSKKIQKFLVLYGPGGTGKSTILNVIGKLFEGYTTTFEAKALVGNNNSFATESFRGNPLVAIQHDGDLSRIEDNSKLNSIISHEPMTMNEKYKATYTDKINAFLFMGTNKPVRISDAKSGVIRRLIDAHPTGTLFQPAHYHTLMAQIDFELGAVAQHCLDVYREKGRNYYNGYRPVQMMLQTDIFFNFIEANFDIFKSQDGCTLKQAYALYKEFCSETGIEFVMPQYKFREELRNYFAEFLDRATVDGQIVRSYYKGFTAQPFKTPVTNNGHAYSLVLEENTSLLDLEYADQPAQLAKDDDTPQKRWADVKTTLSEIDTSQVHYVKVPLKHIVIDFDLKDEHGQKSLEANLAEASGWPPTYAELSKSGNGIHLHYIYGGGDPGGLDRNYSEGIEIKVFSGDSSLRRKLSHCNNVPIATISSGLPFKEKKMLQSDTVKTERGLRELIGRNLRKEIHPGTKPSIDFIAHILNEAYLSGMQYDMTDLRGKLIAFANNSSNQPLQCLKVVQQMRFKSDDPINPQPEQSQKDDRLVFFDVEVYPNLFVICWKYQGSPTTVRMINPSSQEVEALFKLRLIGFNNRRYDNHMLYARFMGYDNEQLYRLSQKIIEGNVGSMFGEAYNLSYTDIYDFSSVKQGLKKFQIDLGLPHVEIDLPWEQSVKEEDIPRVVEYCVNDVESTEVVFESRKQDFVARQILADLSGLSVNDTTQKHTARIVFGEDKNPQRSFIYTDLSKEFPGYVYDKGKSIYREEVTGEGGYVYAEPGMYENVALLDVASMHPTSIIQLNLFGEYTENFRALLDTRLAIKAGDYDTARNLLGGKLAKYLGDDTGAKGLSDALKIVINIVYGLTSAKFDNPFRDVRNVDNIVAKRGSLFMVDLKHAVQEQGYTVAHIKTDSIKIPDATPEIIEFVKTFGAKYGYTFDYNSEEDFYNAITLVNDAVYIARRTIPAKLEGNNDNAWKTKWTAVGAQFQHPYVFKMLFTGDPIEFDDLCETKQVAQGAMYIDFEHDRPMVLTEGMQFIGRTGRFVPVKEGFGGGMLYRVKDSKPYAVSGTKGYLWLEASVAKGLAGLTTEAVDMRYFENLAEEARKTIDYFGEFTRFVG
jgi:energy-coupling factor transporter ATP-binding protein EcfA2